MKRGRRRGSRGVRRSMSSSQKSSHVSSVVSNGGIEANSSQRRMNARRGEREFLPASETSREYVLVKVAIELKQLADDPNAAGMNIMNAREVVVEKASNLFAECQRARRWFVEHTTLTMTTGGEGFQIGCFFFIVSCRPVISEAVAKPSSNSRPCKRSVAKGPGGRTSGGGTRTSLAMLAGSSSVLSKAWMRSVASAMAR